jgi:hypothetical protein
LPIFMACFYPFRRFYDYLAHEKSMNGNLVNSS